MFGFLGGGGAEEEKKEVEKAKVYGGKPKKAMTEAQAAQVAKGAKKLPEGGVEGARGAIHSIAFYHMHSHRNTFATHTTINTRIKNTYHTIKTMQTNKRQQTHQLQIHHSNKKKPSNENF